MSSDSSRASGDTPVRGWHAVLCAILCIAPLVGSACAKARAAAEPQMPALSVPPPPPRVLPPLEGEPIDASAPAPAEPQTRTRLPRQRSEATRSGANGGRPEARIESSTTPAAPAETSPTADAGATTPPVPALQLAPAGDGASEQNTRRRLAQAERDLQRVDYRLLNAEAQAQYDTAKRFITLAEQAIVDRNLLFAHTLADKAATIAAVLQRR